MTKADIIDSVYARLGLTKKESTEVVELLIETMKSTLARGETIKIHGFGHFQVHDKPSRLGRNPQSGAAIELPARRVLSFRASSTLRSRLNAGPQAPAPSPTEEPDSP